MVLFCKTHQVFDFDCLTLVSTHRATVAAEHLVHQAGNDAQVGFRQAVFEGCEHQLQPALCIGKRPRAHIIAGDIIKFDLLQFVDAVVQDDGILPGPGEVAKAAAKVKANAAPIWQEARGAGPVPVGLVFPHPPAPVQRAQTGDRVERFGQVTVAHHAAGGQAVDLAVEIKTLRPYRDGDIHRFIVWRG